MKPFKFIHAADLHLDSPFKGLTDIPQHLKEQVLQSSFHTFARLIDYAIAEHISFIVISGDLFDAKQRSLHAQLFLFQQFERLKPYNINVYIIHGNHDPLSNKQGLFKYSDHIHIFQSDAVTMQPAYHQGELVAYIYGISYGTNSIYENLTKQYFKLDEDVFHLALYHGTVGSSQDHEPYAPCSLQDLISLQYDYVALGHIHKPQLLFEPSPIVYAGNIQGRHRKEYGERGCYVVEVSESKQTSMRFLPLATIQWENITIDCTNIEHEQALIQFIQRQIHKLCSKSEQNYMISLQLQGITPLHQHLAVPEKARELLEALRSLFSSELPWIYISKLIVETKVDYDKESLIAEELFLQKLVANYEQLTKLPADELIQVGRLSELWQHYDLSRLLPNLQGKMLETSLDDVLQSILDYVAQEKGRE